MVWIMLMIMVVVFVFFFLFYSMEWGSIKFEEWFVFFILLFLELVIFVDLVKVGFKVLIIYKF